MKEAIQQELLRLEQEHDIKILLAVESGSRAWGFASADSDWDVRYIYIHRLEWYLRIDEQKDSQEEILSNDIDLAGWELKKALRLFRKSNPPLLEWLRSPIIYLEQYSAAAQLRDLSKQYFNPKSCLHHYLHMAEGTYKENLQKELVRAKKYFYALRPLLACDWIRTTNTMAPMEFHQLLESQVMDPTVKKEIERLLVRKMEAKERSEDPRIELLNDFIEQKIQFYTDYLQAIPRVEQPDTQLLNELFQHTIEEVWRTDPRS